MKLSYITIASALHWQLGTSEGITENSILRFTFECATNCSPDLCSCISTNQSSSSCAPELHEVCATGTIDACVPSTGINQFRAVHCPYAACLVDGRSREECECEMHSAACEIYEDENMGYCEIASCCEDAGDNAGRADCLSDKIGLGATRTTPTLFPNESPHGLTQSAFEMDDSILNHMDDGGEFSIDDSLMTDDATVLTWIDADEDSDVSSPLSQASASTVTDDAATHVDPNFSLPLSFARFCSSNCDPLLCTCLTIKKDYSACISELFFSCRDNSIQQCVPDASVNEFQEIYCPYSECIMLGNVENVSAKTCDHDRYAALCDWYGDDEACMLATNSTLKPTEKPSMHPTSKPSKAPVTDSPTTSQPSMSPSLSPMTSAPSAVPSISPVTPEPSASPSKKLVTKEPSESPITESPSVNPSRGPTLQPSHSPSSSPSLKPTKEPVTNEPTEGPITESPSVNPSRGPTLQPSHPHSGSPSLKPTKKPVTNEPSESPTDEPTWSPTATPTWSPTVQPTEVSDSPTETPSASPTLSPVTPSPISSKPSKSHSSKPTKQPSPAPATSSPSISPATLLPSIHPTATATTIPSFSPTTNRPSKHPSNQPTSDPSASPSTSHPTPNPTNSPTSGDSTQSSETKFPTDQTIAWCPESYDELWTSTYSTGTKVEVSGYIYECNPYPYSIYCKFTDYQPVYGSELWSDAWTVISPCKFPDPTTYPTQPPTTKKPTLLPTALPTSLPPTRIPTTRKPSKDLTSDSSTQSPSPNPTHSTLSSSESPSASANKIEVSTLVQFEMQRMVDTMNQYEQFGVFEPSCENFLTQQLFNEKPRVFNIGCTVTNQQLLSLSSLLIDIEVMGEVLAAENMTSSDDFDFGDMVYHSFADDSQVFINSLKVKGDIAGIDTFDDLESITTITQSSSKDAVTEGDGSDGQGIRTGALAALIIGGVAFVILIIAFVFQVRIYFADDDSLDDDELDRIGLDLPPENIDCTNVLSGESAQRNDSNLSYAYSLDNGIDSPNSIVTSTKPAWDAEAPMRVQREVMAPAGKLGIIIDTSTRGPIVHSVKSESVLEGLVFEGDLIIALDDEQTSTWTAHDLTKLVASKSKYERKITLLSAVTL